MGKVDLHMHSHYSDGKASPEELLKAAKEHGLEAIAITDHDTAEGSREASKLAASYGVELIPAIELTCYWDDYSGHGAGPDIDLLGYFIDLDSPVLVEVERRLEEYAKKRAAACCEILQRMGYAINLEDVLQTNARYPAVIAFIATLLRKKLASVEEASSVAEQAFYTAGRSPLPIQNGIKLIHQLGGVAVLAHPTIIRREADGEPLSERGLIDLKQAGLDGIEIYHHRLRRHHRQHFRMLAQMAGLAMSGGSDEHAGAANFKRFASQPITTEMLESLRARRKHG